MRLLYRSAKHIPLQARRQHQVVVVIVALGPAAAGEDTQVIVEVCSRVPEQPSVELGTLLAVEREQAVDNGPLHELLASGREPELHVVQGLATAEPQCRVIIQLDIEEEIADDAFVPVVLDMEAEP